VVASAVAWGCAKAMVVHSLEASAVKAMVAHLVPAGRLVPVAHLVLEGEADVGSKTL
jgi:hypothetical protein